MTTDRENEADGARQPLVLAYPALDLTFGVLEGPPLLALADGFHPAWTTLLDWQQAHAPGVTRRGEATLFLGQALYFLTVASLSPLFEGSRARLAKASHVALQLSSLEKGNIAACVHIQVLSLEDTLERGPVLESLSRPLVNGLAQRSGLSRSALWRVAGDGIALALLDIARRSRALDEGRHLFGTILKQAGSPFRNRQLG